MTRSTDALGLRTLLAPGLLACLSLAHAQGADPSQDALRMGSPASLAPGETTESMWPAPSAEDWQRPVLVTWQRTFADALRVAKERGMPILVCVNMDGEPASEHFAGIRYRQEETARLLEPYVCVMASVYRHTQRDYDEQGRRVPCPRFGGVTCGEHIAMETELYDRFFDGKRIAPRHILLELEGKKSYDVYYSWDTASVFTAYREGVEDRPPPRPDLRHDLPLAERSASANTLDRVALETAYQRGSREVRRELLAATITHRDVDQIDLLRLALFGLDVELARLARAALAKADSEGAVDLIAEALKLPMDPAEREALLAAAARLAEKYPRARTLVAVQQGLSAPSKWIDLAGWSRDLEAQYRATAGAAGRIDQAARVESRAAAAEAQPADPGAQLDLAESLLARAQDPSTARDFAALWLEDARNAALAAEKLGAQGWRLDAVLAVAAGARGEREEATARALAAIEGGMPRPGADAEPARERTAVAVLALFAQARQRAIAAAYRERKSWPSEWMADVHAAYAVLARHPLGTDVNVADGHDFLRWLGATGRANQALEDGLARFPASWILHERLRARLLWEKGPEGLEADYAERLARPDAAGELAWFAGYASLVAAEHHRRAGAREQALAAYDRGIARFEHDVTANPEHRTSVDHYVALARAGRAHVELEQRDLEAATRDILAALETSPEAAAALDGLGITPVETARMLQTELVQAERKDLAQAIQAGLDAIDPRFLELPAFERGLTRPGDDRRGLRPGGGG
jgi:hypothetical protein